MAFKMPFLSTSTFLYGHIRVVFHHHFFLVVHVEERLRPQLGGNAARLGHGPRIDRVHQRLHDCVIGRIQVVCQRERAQAVAVVRLVPLRRHYPVVESDLLEIHVQRIPLTYFLLRFFVLGHCASIAVIRRSFVPVPLHHFRKRAYLV